MAEEASNIWSQESARKHEKAAAEVATAKKVQGDARQNKIVITEMEEFVLGLQLNGETRKREAQDMFTYEDADDSGTLAKDVVSRLAVIKEEAQIEGQIKDRAVKADEVLHEVPVGKGLAGALKFLQDRGTLNEGVGGEKTTNKKRSNPIVIEDGPKEIRIERTDEFGRVMTMKEAFRELSHKFHGKGPGKTKQEKRQRKYQDELKSKRMKSADMPLMSTEKMRKAQARSKTPYLVLSGGAKSSPR